MAHVDALNAKVAAALAAEERRTMDAAPATSDADFKTRFLPDLPLTRIKRVMRAERGMRMLSTGEQRTTMHSPRWTHTHRLSTANSVY